MADSVLDALGAGLFPSCHCFTDEVLREDHARGMAGMTLIAAQQIQLAIVGAGMCPSTVPSMAAMIVGTLLVLTTEQTQEMGPGVYLHRLRREFAETQRLLRLHLARAERILGESHVVH